VAIGHHPVLIRKNPSLQPVFFGENIVNGTDDDIEPIEERRHGKRDKENAVEQGMRHKKEIARITYEF